MKSRRITAVLLAAVCATAMLAVIPAPAEAATPVSWSADVSGVTPFELMSGKDGSVTAAGCSSAAGSVGTETLSATGSVTGTTPVVMVNGHPRAVFTMCDWQKAIGADGSLYGNDTTSLSAIKFASYKANGTLRWSQQINTLDCTGGVVFPVWGRMGADGNVYVGGQSGSCGSPWYLTSFTPSGTMRWQVRTAGIDLLAPYTNGIVVGSAGTSDIYYYTYGGILSATVPITETGTPEIAGATVGTNGVVTVGVFGSLSSTLCGTSARGAKLIATYQSTGRVAQYVMPNCMAMSGMVATQNGQVSFVQNQVGTSVYSLETVGAGLLIHEMSFPVVDGVRQFDPSALLIADTNGNVLAARHYRFTNDSGRHVGEQFVLVGPDGVVHASFDTQSLNPNKSFVIDPEAISIAPGGLYFATSSCSGDGCTPPGSPSVLYRVAMTKLGMDYPRGALLGVAPVIFGSMTAAGDSFSAGVGSLLDGQTYAPGTDVPNGDQCHRSPNAYGPQLDQNPLVKLQLPSNGFVACSGATTVAITNPYQTEFAQATSIPTNSKAVFLTIGGNDVKFGRLGALCIFLDCSAAQYQTEFNGYLATLQPKLLAAYKALLNRASGATLYVIGYPHILPLQDCTNAGSGAWWFALQAQKVAFPDGYASTAVAAGLTPTEATTSQQGAAPTITNSEATFANTFENSLNLAISNAVGTVKAQYPGRAVYVSTTQPGSPLEGHQLCSSSPDFNGVDGAHPEGIFHPNFDGQAGMSSIAFAALAANQPQYVLVA